MQASSEPFDFGRTLEPIGETGVGDNPRKSGGSMAAFSELKLAYEKLLEDEKLTLMSDDPQLVFSEEWGKIADEGMDFLDSSAKDVEVASWTMAALARIEGFAGLHKGLTLIKGLITQFGDELFPLPKKDNHRFRYIALFRLCGESGGGQLYIPLKSISILKAKSDITAIQYEQYSAPQQPSAKKDHLRALQDAAKAAIKNMDYAEAKGTFDTLQACRQILTEIFAAINQHFDADAKVSENLSELLRNIQVMYITLSSGRFVEQNGTLIDTEQVQVADEAISDEAGGMAIEGASAGATSGSRAGSTAGPISSREDALKRLGMIKDYFRQHEPHSPISYGIERICRWSTLPLPELIAELIQNDSAKEDYINLTGIPEIEYNQGD